LLTSPVRPVTLDLLRGPVRQQAPILGPKPQETAACLYAGFEGAAAEVQWMLETLRAQWNAAGITAISSVADESVARFWQWQTDFPAEAHLHVRPGQVVGLLEKLGQLIPDCSLIAHAGHGEVRAAVGSAECGMRNAEWVKLLREELRPLIASLGGTMTVLSSPHDAVLTRDDIWGPRGDAFAVMQALKDRFDPKNILNPGRYVFEGTVPLRDRLV